MSESNLTPGYISNKGYQYFKDKTILYVTYLGGKNINIPIDRINELFEKQLVKICVKDMKIYESNDNIQWIILGKIIDNNNTNINNKIFDFYYPRDKFSYVKISSLKNIAKKSLRNNNLNLIKKYQSHLLSGGNLNKCLNDPTKTYKGNEPSPKGLGYCAHAEKIGKRMIGKNYMHWIVKKTKNGTKRWVNDEGIIFVFYTIDNPGEWKEKIKKMPKEWNIYGSGHTNPLTKNGMLNLYKYEREEQYGGPMKNREQMKKILADYYNKLKKNGLIKFYKIKFSYKPE